MFKGTMTKWPVQKPTQGTTQKLLKQHDATDIKKTYMFVLFSDFSFLFSFVLVNSSRNSPRNVELPPWNGQ